MQPTWYPKTLRGPDSAGRALLLSLLTLVAALGAFACSQGEGAPQGGASRPAVGVERPAGTQTELPFLVSGWALDRGASEGTGIQLVEVLDGGCQGVVIGIAGYGTEREDIAADYGEQFRYSGFGFEVVRLSPGEHTLAVRTTSTVTDDYNHCEAVSLTVR